MNVNPALDLYSDDIAALYARLAELEARQQAASAAMAQADRAGDADAWDRAAGEHDDLSDEIGPVERRIAELEDDAGWEEWRDQRRNMPIVL